MKDINIVLVQTTSQWFEPYHSLHPDVINSDYDGENTSIEFCGNFDYELLPAKIRHMYIDVEMRMIPFGGIMVRSDFKIKNSEFLSDEIFSVTYLRSMLNQCVQECIRIFKEQCEQFEIKLPRKVLFTDDVLDSIVNESIAHYNEYRKPFDITNAHILTHVGLQCSQSNATFIVIQGTFLILDELIYKNPHFDRKHNKNILCSIVPEQRYITLKMTCLEIVKKPVKLCQYDSTLFFICVDCAMQMLLGDKSDLLVSSLEEKGMTKAVRDAFFKYGTSFFNQIRQTDPATENDIPGLEEKRDWNSLFR